MKKGSFFAVGLGPGDPDLLTVKAIKTIEEAHVIGVPKSGADVNIAVKIAGAHIDEKKVIELDMPMTKDAEKLEKCHRGAAEQIQEILNEGKDFAFLTLGDPTIYSTVMYVHRILKNMGCNTNIIPGITSFCAAAASLDCSLCEKDELLHIIPATFTNLDEISSMEGTKVLMKSGKTIMDVKEKLEGMDAMLVERATMEGEKVYNNIRDLKEPSSYFSIVVVPSEKRQNKSNKEEL